MRDLFKDKEHLVRLAALFAAGVLLFAVLRLLLVPKDFGVYGHFRGNALAELRARPLAYAGRTACLDCHSDVADSQKGSKHAAIGCETCHGPLGRHALEDPSVQAAPKLDTARLCARCHLPNTAKAAKFPQVDPKTHGEGNPCGACHAPHAPEKEPAS